MLANAQLHVLTFNVNTVCFSMHAGIFCEGVTFFEDYYPRDSPTFQHLHKRQSAMADILQECKCVCGH